jgi:TonB family protein
MTYFRVGFIILPALLAGCATVPSVQCSEKEINAWLIENGKVIHSQVRYPASARRFSQEGKTIVSLSINEDGTVKEAAIKQSSGWPALDAEALKLKNAKFSAPICSGQNVSMVASMPMVFSLQ